jgi:uncharacterized membrane protein YgcG
MLKRFWIVAALCATGLLALDTSKLNQRGHVNDFASEMGTSSRNSLEKYSVQLEQKTGTRLVIVLVHSLDGESVENAAAKLFREWGIGSGMLLLFAVDDTQEGAAGSEPDFVARVLHEIHPLLRKDNYNQPLLAAAQKIGLHVANAKGVTLDPPKSTKSNGWFGPAAILLYICIAAFIAGLASIIPGFMKIAVPTMKSPTTWLTVIVLGLLAILFNFVGYEDAQTFLPSALVNFVESAWPLLVVIVFMILLATRGHPVEYVVEGFRGKRRHR